MGKAEKLPSGSWRVRIQVGGKRLSVTGRTRREAEQKARAAEYASAKRADLTFGEALIGYVRARSNVLSPSTVRSYESLIRRVPDQLRGQNLYAITNITLQTSINEMAGELSAKTLANLRSLYSATLKMYRPDLLIRVAVPQRMRRPCTMPTEAQVRILIEKATPRMALAVKLAAFGSLRRSEICALYADCVLADSILIRRACVSSPDGWVVQDKTKTPAGTREIPLPADLIRELQAASSNCPAGFPIVGFVHPSSLDAAWHRLRKKAGLDDTGMRFHDLRHFFASEMHARGLPDQYIAKVGGWDDVATLQRIYQHAMEDHKQRAADTIRDFYADLVDTKVDTN